VGRVLRAGRGQLSLPSHSPGSSDSYYHSDREICVDDDEFRPILVRLQFYSFQSLQKRLLRCPQFQT
jgi:hypothetical protein